MSDLMLLGILRMPISSYNNDPIAITQFINAARSAADRIEADAAEISKKNAEIAELKHDVEQLQKSATAEATLVDEIAKQVRERCILLMQSAPHRLTALTFAEVEGELQNLSRAIRTANLTDLLKD